MRCLVTGGAGFIGSNLTDTLLGDGHEVAVVDNESADSNEKFYWNPDSEQFKININDTDNIQRVFKNYRPEWVFHLAAEARIQPSIDRPIEACDVNFMGTVRLLDLCSAFEIDKFIYSSTSASYGLKNKPPLRENMRPDCLNPYSASKVASESFCKIYYKLHDLKTICLRYFNVYGDRQPVKGQYAPVIGLFLKQFKEKREMTIVGDGLQSRDFTHVKDVVAANILAAKCNNKGAFGEVFNVGTGEAYGVGEIAQIIGGKTINIPFRPGEARHSLADNTKIKEYLGWKPKYKLKEYIKQELKNG